jgi:hypothetical protein
MRKRILSPSSSTEPRPDHDWLDLDHLAQVEISSEDAAHPIESALSKGVGAGWRAAGPGEQTIRILFDAPTRLRHVRLLFEETEHARTQEFVLRWSADGGRTLSDVVRQQENYTVELSGVTTLELKIVPQIGGGEAKASLRLLRIA